MLQFIYFFITFLSSWPIVGPNWVSVCSFCPSLVSTYIWCESDIFMRRTGFLLSVCMCDDKVIRQRRPSTTTNDGYCAEFVFFFSCWQSEHTRTTARPVRLAISKLCKRARARTLAHTAYTHRKYTAKTDQQQTRSQCRGGQSPVRDQNEWNVFITDKKSSALNEDTKSRKRSDRTNEHKKREIKYKILLGILVATIT